MVVNNDWYRYTYPDINCRTKSDVILIDAKVIDDDDHIGMDLFVDTFLA